MTRLVLLCGLLALLAGLLPLTASAHPALEDSLWVLLEPTRLRMAVNVSVREMAIVQGWTGEGAPDAAALAAAVEKHRAYLLAHLHLSAGGQPLTGSVVKVTNPPLEGSPEKTFYQYELEFPLPAATPGAITIGQDMLREFNGADGTPWEVTYLVRVKRTPDAEPETHILQSRGILRLPAPR
jgi:hypothetical protein